MMEEVSSKRDVVPRTYRRPEQGTQRPHLHSLKRLCTLFECSAEDLGYSIDLLTNATTRAASSKKPQQTMQTFLAREISSIVCSNVGEENEFYGFVWTYKFIG